MNVFESLGIEPIINASGAVTRLGGAPMPQAVLDAYCAAARDSVPLDQLQGAASRLIAQATGAEAAIVTSGAAAALTLGAAAILAGNDLKRMESLPHCNFPCEFIVPREQRNGYDHAVRAAGARLVEVGFHEPVAGSGVRRCEAWEIEAAIGPDTAGILFVHASDARPRLEEIVAVAQASKVPVLVDAAGELPPRQNLRQIIAAGADLVAFSGGKAIRGPQATGILCGRRDLIGSAALQMLDMDDHFELWEPPPELIDKRLLKGMPRHGIGRNMKVSKEQIAALLAALQMFVSGAYDDERLKMHQRLVRVSESLRDAPVGMRLIDPSDGESAPVLELVVNESRLGRSALEVCRRLRRGSPPIYVGHGSLEQGVLVIHPLHLDDNQTAVLIRRLREELQVG